MTLKEMQMKLDQFMNFVKENIQPSEYGEIEIMAEKEYEGFDIVQISVKRSQDKDDEPKPGERIPTKTKLILEIY